MTSLYTVNARYTGGLLGRFLVEAESPAQVCEIVEEQWPEMQIVRITKDRDIMRSESHESQPDG